MIEFLKEAKLILDQLAAAASMSLRKAKFNASLFRASPSENHQSMAVLSAKPIHANLMEKYCMYMH